MEDIKPYAHQQEAIEKTIEYFSNISNTRGKVIMPCGSGKSLTSLWILKQIENTHRTLITVPNLILQSQIFTTFYQELSSNHRFICIGSDEDVKIDFIDEKIIVSTKPIEVKNFLNCNTLSNVIVIATYQSLPNLAQICNEYGYEFDLGIIDEAHRTVGSKQKSFSTILFDEEIKIKNRIFMTATERVYSGSKDEIIGMNNSDYYGNLIYEYSLPQAISDDILCDYKIASIYSTSDEIAEFINSNKSLKEIDLGLSQPEFKKIISSLLATIIAIRDKGCRKIVTYHSTVKKAKIFKKLLDAFIDNDLIGVKTFHVNGKQNIKERRKNMEGFKNSNISVLTNSKALVEGVDIPCIDCVVFSDKKDAAVEIIQAVGRALRKFKDKTESYIIIPVLIESLEDEVIKESDFTGLFNVLITLSMMDERVLCEVKELGSKSKSAAKKSNILEVVIPEINVSIKNKINQLVDKVFLNVWNKNNRTSFLPYEEAKKWVRDNLVPLGINSMNIWVKNTHNIPFNIPKAPCPYYAKTGEWNNWGDWFGTGTVHKGNFLPYKEAKDWVQNNLVPLGVDNSMVWLTKDFTLPANIPKDPARFYIKTGEWKNWGDWFGTGTAHKGNFLPYKEAKDWVQNNLVPLGIDNSNNWKKTKKPSNIPSHPRLYYSKTNDWKGWGDWFGRNK
jgi:predicted helicase